MIDHIKTERVINQPLPETDELFRQNLLLNEIKGVETNFYIIKKQQTYTFTPLNRRARVLIILSNSGVVYSNNYSYKLKEMAVLAQLDNSTVTIESTSNHVELVEVLMDLTPDDLEKTNYTNQGEFFFKHFSEGVTYREKVKSSKTINRTLLPVNVIPRMVIGSVQTEGPDQVKAHSHPMLEQLFWGLPGNHCLVKADEQEKQFGEKTLLHIPHGSKHGIKVESGKHVHYLWLDFFQDLESVSYIDVTHLPDKE